MSEEEATSATWSVPQAATILGISTWLYYDKAKKGLVPIIIVGTRRLVPKIQLDAFLAGTWRAAS